MVASTGAGEPPAGQRVGTAAGALALNGLGVSNRQLYLATVLRRQTGWAPAGAGILAVYPRSRPATQAILQEQLGAILADDCRGHMIVGARPGGRGAGAGMLQSRMPIDSPSQLGGSQR